MCAGSAPTDLNADEIKAILSDAIISAYVECFNRYDIGGTPEAFRQDLSKLTYLIDFRLHI